MCGIIIAFTHTQGETCKVLWSIEIPHLSAVTLCWSICMFLSKFLTMHIDCINRTFLISLHACFLTPCVYLTILSSTNILLVSGICL